MPFRSATPQPANPTQTFRLASQLHDSTLDIDMATAVLSHMLPGGRTQQALIREKAAANYFANQRDTQAISHWVEVYDVATMQGLQRAYRAEPAATSGLRALHQRLARLYTAVQIEEDLQNPAHAHAAVGLPPAAGGRSFGPRIDREQLSASQQLHHDRAAVMAQIAWGHYKHDMPADNIARLCGEMYVSFTASELQTLLRFALTPAGVAYHARTVELGRRAVIAGEKPGYRAGLVGIAMAVAQRAQPLDLLLAMLAAGCEG